ncbi:ABC transporter ATP-binding protein [Limibaculum sp. M0105]|uniref:ABC transporter ATP-binding protein n=1 Tax=Thermohalobaculum xanthum TaxID=2753746 RepID=A0A8J7M998_9RHOB|nr:ABC transporter ATP-binding protein [Thermohalobaculum xanthum]MBK0400686.1 ABC transporter ATP-binding protein [Thermohalobaculum xanthum]
MLSVTSLVKSYPTPQGRLEVLRGADLDVAAGECVALTGESGSGKSTLLHLIAGLDAADDGEITIGGTPLRGLDDRGRARLRREHVGLVFQQFNLIPSLRVGANLAFQARIARRHDPQWEAMLADRLGIAALLDRYPDQISGGQQQRVAIGRALAARPPLILADEPTGNLDEATSEEVVRVIRDLVRESGAACLMVTHSTHLAGMLDRRLHLTGGHIA